jgi:hypothetical protein
METILYIIGAYLLGVAIIYICMLIGIWCYGYKAKNAKWSNAWLSWILIIGILVQESVRVLREDD